MIGNKQMQEWEARRKKEEEEVKELLKKPHWYHSYTQKVSQMEENPQNSAYPTNLLPSKDSSSKNRTNLVDFIEEAQPSYISDIF